MSGNNLRVFRLALEMITDAEYLNKQNEARDL